MPRATALSLVLCCSVVTGACRTSTDALPLAVSISSDRASIAPGQAARLRIVVVNLGVHPISLPSPHCPHYFAVTDAQSREAGPPRTMCATYLLMPTLVLPGDSLVLNDAWAADSGQAYESSVARVAPGTYELRARFLGPGGIESAPLSVVVEP